MLKLMQCLLREDSLLFFFANCPTQEQTKQGAIVESSRYKLIAPQRNVAIEVGNLSIIFRSKITILPYQLAILGLIN